jgi:3-oxoacid CoA-transferase
VDLIITEKCVFEVNKDEGLILTEIADGVTVPEIMDATGCDFQVRFKR